jgi:hypothetical protein
MLDQIERYEPRGEDCGAHMRFLDQSGHETVVICSLLEHDALCPHFDFRLQIAWCSMKDSSAWSLVKRQSHV